MPNQKIKNCKNPNYFYYTKNSIINALIIVGLKPRLHEDIISDIQNMIFSFEELSVYPDLWILNFDLGAIDLQFNPITGNFKLIINDY